MKQFLKTRVFGVRPVILLIFIIGLSLLGVALIPESTSRVGWIVQYPRDLGYVLTGIITLYGVHLLFSHLRVHQVKKTPDEFSWKHIVLVCTMVISCAHIIASVLG